MYALSRLVVVLALCLVGMTGTPASIDELAREFADPPAAARPWVYWFWMDGNSSREGITADFEAMQRAGIGGVYQMEVDVGIPRGPVAFMSAPWRDNFDHAVREADRLGLQIAVNAGPGWTGSGGPWVKPEQSMQKLVFSETTATGGIKFSRVLPMPPVTHGFYRDVAVLAFPTPSGNYRIPRIDEKALYHRGHISSEAGVPSYLPEPDFQKKLAPEELIDAARVVNLTSQMDTSGTLTWDAPAGEWTIMRFGDTSTGANTRPAPQAGLGLECDKMSSEALAAHFEHYMQPLIDNAGPLAGKSLSYLHIDSWEMGTQNWTQKFPQEFAARRGYDIIPWLPVFAGRVINNLEQSERFLWDVRRTVQELIVENHAEYLKQLGRKSNMQLSIEPYDGNPICDMQLGSVADVPMCEFWSNCFKTWFSCFEATSITHTYGRSIVAAEAFTADDAERWNFWPGSMKSLGDWAFCRGINRFSFHRYAHQPWLDRAPGMTMGPYGVHFERTQTWWEMADEYTRYIARCQYLLQQGTAVVDVCYVAPEDAPFVFRPPTDAVTGDPPVPRFYSFDCCTADALVKHAHVVSGDNGRGRVAFENGSSYAALVLPERRGMSLELLRKLEQLLRDGATVIGGAPDRSLGLAGFPGSDQQVREAAERLWRVRTAGVQLAGQECPAYMQGTVQNTSETVNRIREGRVIALSEDRVTTSHAVPSIAELWANAKWIWSADEPHADSRAAVGSCYFRVELPGDKPIATVASAHFVGSADNEFVVYPGTKQFGRENDFRQAHVVNVTLVVKRVFTVEVKNSGQKPNPAGLIGALYLVYDDGSTRTLPTNRSWTASRVAAADWESVPAERLGWKAAVELASHGSAPWGNVREQLEDPPLYPPADKIARVLGLKREPIDFCRRSLTDGELYFLRNDSDVWRWCTAFTDLRNVNAQVWDPLTGERGQPVVVHQTSVGTHVKLKLQPQGSRFVVFKQGGKAQRYPELLMNNRPFDIEEEANAGPAGRPHCDTVTSGEAVAVWQDGQYAFEGQPVNVTLPQPVTIPGPWDVRFQPGRGAPESIRLEKLADLSAHADERVRHFSGIATYSTRFQIPDDVLSTSRVLQLDLGDVQVMARVRLNGTTLRTLWKSPYVVDVTSAAKSGENEIEIEVANLWPNRLIGDAALPENQRVAKSTWNPFKPDDPLPKSGLIGPVILCPGALLQISR